MIEEVVTSSITTKIRTQYMAKLASALDEAKAVFVRELPKTTIWMDQWEGPPSDLVIQKKTPEKVQVKATLSGAVFVRMRYRSEDFPSSGGKISDSAWSDIKSLMEDMAPSITQKFKSKLVQEIQEKWEGGSVWAARRDTPKLGYLLLRDNVPSTEWSPTEEPQIKVGSVSLKFDGVGKATWNDVLFFRFNYATPAVIVLPLKIRPADGLFNKMKDQELRKFLLTETGWMSDLNIDIAESANAGQLNKRETNTLAQQKIESALKKEMDRLRSLPTIKQQQLAAKYPNLLRRWLS